MQAIKDPDAFVRRAEAIYNRKYRAEFEPKYHGRIVAIDIKSGDAFVGKTELDAFEKARKKHPRHYFFFLRVGYKATQRITSPHFRKPPAS
ncbi:MAG TPA: hypothetical protein VJ793_14805 [Anaerolineae bacterium]|nr:hypothetical protein [Anaerolineae bacterium]